MRPLRRAAADPPTSAGAAQEIKRLQGVLADLPTTLEQDEAAMEQARPWLHLPLLGVACWGPSCCAAEASACYLTHSRGGAAHLSAVLGDSWDKEAGVAG